MGELWSYILTAVGLTGFFLAGKKVWWCWYVNIANQILWAAYALITDQLGFLIGTFAYTFVFVKNAYAWTRDRNKSKEPKIVGRVTSVLSAPEGVYATMEITDEDVWQKIAGEGVKGFSFDGFTKPISSVTWHDRLNEH